MDTNWNKLFPKIHQSWPAWLYLDCSHPFNPLIKCTAEGIYEILRPASFLEIKWFGPLAFLSLKKIVHFWAYLGKFFWKFCFFPVENLAFSSCDKILLFFNFWNLATLSFRNDFYKTPNFHSLIIILNGKNKHRSRNFWRLLV